MAHVRTQLRTAAEAAVSAMASAPTVRGMDPHDIEAPAVRVTIPAEAVRDDVMAAPAMSGSAGLQLRTMTLEVACFTKTSALGDAEDAADALASEVETALFGAATLIALTQDFALTGMRRDIGGRGRDRTVATILTFEAEVRTGEGAPDTAV